MRMSDITIFDIQRASFVDGPGIRTVVFFKGCNLRCLWCHNPESIQAQKQLAYFKLRCARCGRCANTCPQRAINDDLRTDASRCLGCGQCENVCLASARKLYGKQMSAGEIMKIILADAPFYITSGSGVTLSGGECMLQIDALYELSALCHLNGVSVAIDTAGNVPFESFSRVLELADWILYDIKCVTPDTSMRLIGSDGARILANYRALHSIAREKLIARVPVVPGLNDAEMNAIAAFLAEYPPARAELLPYHKLGESKAETLGYLAFTCAPPSEARMRELRALFSNIAF